MAQVTSGYVYQEDPDGVYRGKYRRLADNTKLDALLEILSDELEGEKVIVWVRWLEELDVVAEGLKKSRIGFVELSGRTSKRVSEQLSVWRAPDGPTVLLATVQTGGEGLTLNEASAMVFYSVGYDWEVYQQAIDRNYRIGQQKRVVVLRLVAQKTVDVEIVKVLARKGRLADLVLGAGEGGA
jgi:SNF2 family DNA or RNA helicase